MHIGEIEKIKASQKDCEKVVSVLADKEEHIRNVCGEDVHIAIDVLINNVLFFSKTIRKLLRQGKMASAEHEKYFEETQKLLEEGRISCGFCEHCNHDFGMECYNINSEYYQKSIVDIPEKRCKNFKYDEF